MDPNDLLHHQPYQRVAVAEVGQRRRDAPEPAEQPGMPEHPIAQRPALLLSALVLRPPDVFLDGDSVRKSETAVLA